MTMKEIGTRANERLIDADALVEQFQKTTIDEVFQNWNDLNPSVTAAILRLTRKYRSIILNAPKVDAVPVVHGRWKWRHTNEYTEVLTCSVCSKTEGADENHKYCPNCGARMDGDGNA